MNSLPGTQSLDSFNVEAAALQPPQISESDVDFIRNSNVVIFDENATTTETIRTNLTAAGFKNIDRIHDIEQIFPALQSSRPDIVLLGMSTPLTGGLEILKLVKTGESTQDIPVIVLTDPLDAAARQATLNSGAHDFVNKPVDPRELIARVANALHGKHRTPVASEARSPKGNAKSSGVLQHEHKLQPLTQAEQRPPEEGRILIIDDEPAVTGMLRNQLQKSGFPFVEMENNALQALTRVASDQPDLIILDIRMPGINGLEILQQLRSTTGISSIPVLIMTSSSDERIRMAALQLQANDFLTKPANSAELAARVRNSLMLKMQHDQLKSISAQLRYEVDVRTEELFATRRESILCLARTAESRDTETGQHVVRVGHYAAIVARALGLESDTVSWLELAAQLHDVGKIAIPDSILYKPGNLTDEEFEIMKTHCLEAERIFGDAGNPTTACTSPVLKMAARIALTHHERWDGEGYPHGLAGEDIPLEGRITAVVDVFDALSSQRPYKEAYPVDECYQIMKEGRGTMFDPDVLDTFFSVKHKILDALERLRD